MARRRVSVVRYGTSEWNKAIDKAMAVCDEETNRKLAVMRGEIPENDPRITDQKQPYKPVLCI